MPLQTQLATDEQAKRQAFLTWFHAKDSSNKSSSKVKQYISGYTTRPGCPVYILGETAYPLQRLPENDVDEDCWNSFLVLPKPLVPEGDVGIVAESTNDNSAKVSFEIPLDLAFFANQLGNQLLVKDENNVIQRSDMTSVLQNKRLVALYFSAHW